MTDLNRRLALVANKVRKGSVVADIGCDHAYLATYLVKNGICPFAIGSDINTGPLESARETVVQNNLSEKIELRLGNGLDKILPNECEDIVIAGMGGELIAEILSNCPWSKDKSKHFVFQPMTHHERLIEYLVRNSYEIISQDVVVDDKRSYTVFDSKYTGKNYPEKQNNLYYFVGEIKDFQNNDTKEFFSHILNYLKNKTKGGANYSAEIKFIEGKL